MLARVRSTLAPLAWFVLLSLGCSKDNTVVAGAAICAAGQYNCRGDLLQVCNAARTGWDDLETCDPGACVQGEAACRQPEGGAGSGGSGGTGTGGTGEVGGSGGTGQVGGSGGGQTGGTGGTEAGTGGTGGDPLDAGVEAEADAPPPNYATLPEFCNAYATAECNSEMLAVCGVTEAQCEGKRAQRCIQNAPAGKDYRPSASGQCVATVAAAYADATTTYAELIAISRTCGLVFQVEGDAGAICSTHWDCDLDDGLLCIKNDLLPCDQAKCLEPVQVDAGDVCSSYGMVCPDGYSCTLEFGTCVAWSKKGEKCVDGCSNRIRCESHLQCVTNPSGGKWCQDKLVNGSPCTQDSQCAGGICVLDVMGPDAGTACADEHEYWPGDPGCKDFGKI